MASKSVGFEAAVASSDAFGLLAYYGKESAGAITLVAPGEVQSNESGYRPLTDQALHERITKLPKQSLAANAPKHMFFVMRLAARLGLSVPPVQIRYVPDPIYLIERFDRQQEGRETRRLHIIDACQALGLDRTFKYQQATVANLTRCVDICANRARSRQSILEWVLFNVLVGNGDTHFKNLSFRVHPGGIDLAPFYDLVSTESYHAELGNDPRWPNVDFSIQIGEAKKFAAIRRNHFLAFADELGVNSRAASRLLDEFRAAIGPAADELVAEFETSDIPQAVRAGQLRVLHSIRYTVIREMVGRLR